MLVSDKQHHNVEETGEPRNAQSGQHTGEYMGTSHEENYTKGEVRNEHSKINK